MDVSNTEFGGNAHAEFTRTLQYCPGISAAPDLAYV